MSVRSAATASLVAALPCMPRFFCRRATSRSLAFSTCALPMYLHSIRRFRQLGIQAARACRYPYGAEIPSDHPPRLTNPDGFVRLFTVGGVAHRAVFEQCHAG